MTKLRKAGIIVLIFAAVLLIFYFSARNFLLAKIMNHVSGKLKADYHAELSYSEARFTGFSSVAFRKIILMPSPADTMLSIDSVVIRPSLLSLLTARIKLNEAHVKNLFLDLSCSGNTCNYDFLLRATKTPPGKTAAEKNYSAQVHRLVGKLFDLSPQEASFQNIHVAYSKDGRREEIHIPSFSSSDKTMEGSLLNTTDHYQWKLAGNFSQNKRTFDVKIYPEEGGKSKVPLVNLLLNADAGFDTLHCVLSDYRHAGNSTSLTGYFRLDNVVVSHPKISDEPVSVHHGDFNFNVKIGTENIELDSSSFFVLNSLKAHPYIKYEKSIMPRYTLKLYTDKTGANDFFSSLPWGMFDAVGGMQAEGTLQFLLDFYLDSAQPDSLVFNSSLQKEKFRIKKFGKENLQKLNGEFLYSVYERGRFIRSFMVGPSNPDFTPLDQVSPSLKNAVMTSEDGSFFYHNGFNEDAFRKSIAANYKAGRFVRGGSTITMQLVKNVFLTRHKTISRKAEEALIVWLIESNNLCSKERMLEVYLNIIELGPDIYGVGEASRFYFNKKPSELSLAESVFLASLLPHPKWFKYSFDEGGNLKPYFADYYRVVANFLLKKNLITQQEYDQLQPRIELKGPAKNSVVPADSLPEDED